MFVDFVIDRNGMENYAGVAIHRLWIISEQLCIVAFVQVYTRLK